MSISKVELGQRIRTAREACQLTQEDVAKRLDISRATMTQIEHGNRGVSSLELEKLAFIFGRDIREFVAESFRDEDILTALFRAQPEVVSNPEVVERLRECVKMGRELSNLESLVGIERNASSLVSYRLPAPKTKVEAIQQGERVASSERQRLGLGLLPIPDLIELLEHQGIRTGVVDLPEDVSGLSFNDAKDGFFVVVNRGHLELRRRFSFAHEYAHLLIDSDRFSTVSKASDHDNLIEVRANSFAARFLLPDEAMEKFISGMGKGKPSRTKLQVFDENTAQVAEGRAIPNSQDIQIYDVVMLAHQFDVSVQSAIYCLRNQRLITDTEMSTLLREDTDGIRETAQRLLGLKVPTVGDHQDDFQRRFLGLALDAYRRELISIGKLRELARLMKAPMEELEELIESLDSEMVETESAK